MTAVEKMGETMLLRGDAELTEFGRGTGTAGSDVRAPRRCAVLRWRPWQKLWSRRRCSGRVSPSTTILSYRG